jgi:hypothetical protein
MHWTYKPLPRLIVKIMCLLICINTVIVIWKISDGNPLHSLGDYILIAVMLLFAALVTVVKKPTDNLTAFVIICDVLIIAGLIISLWVETPFPIVFLLIVLPVIALLIVLSRPNTAHYMMDKYHESVRRAEKQDIA